MRKIVLLCCALAVLVTACNRPGRPGRTTTTARPSGPVATLPPGTGDCDRACLTGVLDQYLDALVARDPSGLPLAANARFTEDTVERRLGEGLWRTATRLRPYRQDVIDVYAGVAGTHVVVEEGTNPVLLVVRLRVVSREITEIETMAVRSAAEGSIFSPNNLREASPAMTVVPPANQRNTRAELIRVAEAYPAGLKAGSFVTVNAQFSADAYRFENGTKMAGPGCVFGASCANIRTQAIPRLANLTYRLAAVDEELGIVWMRLDFGAGSIGAGRSLIVWEMFKVHGGQMHAVEAFMESMPANSPSGW